MATNKSYDATVAGKICVTNGYFSAQANPPGQGFEGQAYGAMGMFTGNVTTDNSGTNWYEVEVFSAELEAINSKWMITGSLKIQEPGNVGSGKRNQNYVDDILKDHKYIMQNLMVVALGCKAMRQTSNTAEVESMELEIARAYRRLKERESMMINERIITSYSQGHDDGAAIAGADALNSICKEYGVAGVGAVPAIVYIIVTAIVTLTMTVLLYYKLKRAKDDADYDLALSNEFMRWFNKQPADAQKIVMTQLKATGDSAWRSAMDASKGTAWYQKGKNLIMLGAAAVGLIYVADKTDAVNKAKRQWKKATKK